MRVAGVDGTKRGWVAVVLEDGVFARDHIVPAVASSFDELGDVAVIAIDVPIGFGPRQADAAARAYLKGAASTVFSTPPRAALEVPFGPGLGVSAQAHALGPRRHRAGAGRTGRHGAARRHPRRRRCRVDSDAIAAGTAHTLPDPPEVGDGRSLAMWV